MNLVGPTSTSLDFLNLALGPSSSLNVTFNGNGHNILFGNFVANGGTNGFGNFEISGLNLSNGNLDISNLNSTSQKLNINNSKINGSVLISNAAFGTNPTSLKFNFSNLAVTNGHLDLSDIRATDLLVNNSTFESGGIFISSSYSDNIPTNIVLNNVSVMLEGDIEIGSGSSGAFGNLNVSNLTLTNGSFNAFQFDISSLDIVFKDSYVNGSVLIDKDYGGVSTRNVTVSNLTLTNGSLELSGITSSKLLIQNSNLSNTSYLGSYSPGIILNNMTATDGKIVNTTVTLGTFSLIFSKGAYDISGNRFSNSGYVFDFRDLNFVSPVGVDIYNNKLCSDMDYIFSTGDFSANVTFYKAPTSGRSIMGGSNIAGNYWTNSDFTGHSDLLSVSALGYSDVPYLIPASVGVYSDNYSLTKPPSNGGGGGTEGPAPIVIPPAEPEPEPPQTPPANPEDPTPETPGPGAEPPSGSYSAGSGSGTNQILTELKDEGLSTEEVVTGYVAPASVVLGATAGSVLLIISGIIDFFFDVTSGQVRGLAKGKASLKFNPPGLSQIFSARTAYMVLFFIFGIGVIDTFLGDAVEASMNGGLLTPFTAYISPLVLSTTVNIGGGLFFDEVLEFIFKRIGKYVNQTTGILDLIKFGGTANAIVFVCLIGLAGGLLAFCVYFLEWTLI
ncbi:hypothetical protein LJX78_03170 [Methanimicrococcus blatticola]|uniref:hypothetical protein n=1 Tax=Methanimicrococcus blatticola TaxID=91560 RepID=UPI00105FD71C|nr:hypothetical protein [Methanimicrococcus blatticola]MBZ3935291.1 hypothetical protein [Methanimicrococcus blatticola]MCC2508611.1 hypothetical protein [Methanimicrococcus blatticola]